MVQTPSKWDRGTGIRWNGFSKVLKLKSGFFGKMLFILVKKRKVKF